MALFPDGRKRGNGPKKTRQGVGRSTKFGIKPQTHLGMFPSTKAIKRYKKKSRGQGK
jgi:hypothetical protein